MAWISCLITKVDWIKTWWDFDRSKTLDNWEVYWSCSVGADLSMTYWAEC